MTNVRLFSWVGMAALAAGTLLWWVARTPGTGPDGRPMLIAPTIAPSAILSAGFRDGEGRVATLGRFAGRLVVVNFWATWCAPCRAEMPGFNRLQAGWAGRGVQFVGLSDEAPEVAARFGRELGLQYPLWTGGEQALTLSRRLGNRDGVLPHTVILGPSGEVLDQRVGTYSEEALGAKLAELAPILVEPRGK